jgi:lipopolysaccharide biosynthesis glycosyltransferase
METNKIPIVFSANDRYAELLGVALCSLFENKAATTEPEIFVLDGGICEKNKKRLAELENRYSFKINYLTIPEKIKNLCPNPVSMYTHLFSPELINCPRLLKLDADILILDDLTPLFKTDLKGKTFGAAENVIEDYKRLAVKDEFPSAFNNGVLLINTTLWKKNSIGRRTIDFVVANQNRLKFWEQEALNQIGKNSWKKLNQKYNRQIDQYSRHLPKETTIVHYISEKPNNLKYCGHLRKEYWKYRQLTPWSESPLMDINLWSFLKKMGRITILRPIVMLRLARTGILDVRIDIGIVKVINRLLNK